MIDKHSMEFLKAIVQINMINDTSKGWVRHESDFNTAKNVTLSCIQTMFSVACKCEDISDFKEILKSAHEELYSKTHDQFKEYIDYVQHNIDVEESK